MIFNGIEKPYIKVTTDFFRPPTAPIEIMSNELSGGGSRTRNKRIMSMTLPVPIVIHSDQHVEFLKEELATWLVHEQPKPLEFKQIPDRHYLAEYEDAILSEKGGYAKGELYFHLAQPYRFSPERTINLTTAAKTEQINGHTSTTWMSKTIFTSAQSSYTFEFSQEGKLDLREINKIRLNYNFVEGDVLRIDYKRRLVTVNDVDITNTVVILQSNFMELPIGEVEFKASHKTEVIYNERFY